MLIEVKGVNDVLVLKARQDCSFQLILNDLNTLLDQPIFNQDGYYPRAFFDFGCRQLENNDIESLMGLLKEKKKIIFDGMSLPHVQNQLEVNREQLHNGEEVHIYNETLFLGIVNPGSYVYCYDNVYFLNAVKGTIIVMNEDVKIYGHDFQKAQIIVNQKTLHDLTVSALTSIYYKDNQIHVEREDNYGENNTYYIG